MEAPTCRTRKDPVARFNSFEEPEKQIKAQIEDGLRTQKAIRARATPANLRTTPLEEAAPTAIRKSRALEYIARPDSVNALAEIDRHSLDRTFSFNSLSTLQRDAEAARLSQWRDSPVSAFSPTDRIGCPNGDTKSEIHVPYPPMAVYTLKQSRKDEKEQRKSIKKQEKEQKKADKSATHRRRHSMATDTATPGSPQHTSADASDTSSTPRRAISDPSFKASRDAAVRLVKKLTSKPMNKLSRRAKAQQSPVSVPHIDDFLSKPDLHEYLNSDLPEPNLPIAELPGPLPPYTPFQNLTRNADNSNPTSDALGPGQHLVQRSPSDPLGLYSDGLQPQRMMRCDKCQFGIKLDAYYFQCSVCENGDRIICSACDAAGESCRHELTRRQRQVLGYGESSQHHSSSRPDTHKRHDFPPRAATFGTTEEMHRQSDLSQASHHMPSAPSVRQSRTTTHELQERKHMLDLRDLDIRRREQDLLHQERETVLRQREAALQERHKRVRERETDVESKALKHKADARTSDSFSRQCSEMANFLGSQFASLQAQLLEVSKSMPMSPVSDEVDDDFNLSDSTGFRSHAGKRKASGKARAGSNTSPGRPGRPSMKPVAKPDPESPDEDDEADESGTPKKMKTDPESATSPGKLYACHYCKHDSSRYSERNSSEKHYRGCSSGYWPDISRLKQHLYRVHWRNHHCQQCFAIFKKASDLQEHSRGSACRAEECPFPEKFEHDKYNEIRKKRPTNTAEEVWYLIYGILFPGEPCPATPYADSIDSQEGSFSGPNISQTQQTWNALGNAFESRLDQHQDAPNQAWLREAGIRDFIREQLRASMAEVLQHITPATTPAATPLSADRSPRLLNEQDAARRLSIPADAFSLPASPVTHSAASSRSTSNAQWRLPNHRRSFSRPLRPQTVFEGSKIWAQRPVLSLDTVSTPSEITFNVTTPGNPEDDQYDDECGSWHQNDDSLGFAISTDNAFDFDFSHMTAMEGPQKVDSRVRGQSLTSDSVHATRPFEFRPVKVSTLTETPAQIEACTTKRAPVVDSAYGSLESNHASGGSRPNRQYVKSTVTPMHVDGVRSSRNSEIEVPVPEHELNMEALKVPWQEFLGAEMDECGNIGGRSLSEYLDTTYGVTMSI